MRRLRPVCCFAVALVAGCTGADSDSKPSTTSSSSDTSDSVTTQDSTPDTIADAPEAIDLPVVYTDPDGRFELSFPFEPAVESTPGEAGRLALVSITASTDDYAFAMAYSDVPPTARLTLYQELPESVAKDNADNDGGVVADVHTTTMFGRSALEFEVVDDDVTSDSRYFDVNVILGGRRYELSVVQHTESRAVFDAFVASFHLLEPPLADDADFFGVAEALCAAFHDSRPPRPDNETVEEHAAAIQAVVDHFRDRVTTLSDTAATADEQGAAAAFIDAVRRSDSPGQRYVDAILASDPDADAIAQEATPDLELATQIAEEFGAPSCA